MSAESWQFSVANSNSESQECLFRLFTDPRSRPLDVQAVIGSPLWSDDMWDYLPAINMDEPQLAEHKWSVYIIRLQGLRITDAESDQSNEGIYVGSAQAQSRSTDSMVGETFRLHTGHERMFRMSPDDILKSRKGHKSLKRALYVHEIGVRPGVRRTYYSTASFPVISFPSQFQRRIKQAIHRLENDQAIMLDSLHRGKIRGGDLSKQLKQHSRIYMEKMRLLSWPRPPWTGLNRVLPSTQRQTGSSAGTPTALSCVYDTLRKFHEKSGKIHLDASDVQSILEEKEESGSWNGVILPPYVDTFMRQCFRNVLRDNGLVYETGHGQRIRSLFPILWGLAQHVKESDLILGEQNEGYIIHWIAIDWCRVAQLAQKIAPKSANIVYSATLCSQYAARGYENSIFREVLPYKLNFDRILGMLDDFYIFNRLLLSNTI